jgi:hypothetical protein
LLFSSQYVKPINGPSVRPVTHREMWQAVV